MLPWGAAGDEGGGWRWDCHPGGSRQGGLPPPMNPRGRLTRLASGCPWRTAGGDVEYEDFYRYELDRKLVELLSGF